MTACCAPSNAAWIQTTSWRRDATCHRSNRRVLPAFRSNAADPLQAWPAVEIGVKAQDRLHPVVFHDGDVEGVPAEKEFRFCAISAARSTSAFSTAKTSSTIPNST